MSLVLYKCLNCGFKFEVRWAVPEKALNMKYCPNCGKRTVEKV